MKKTLIITMLIILTLSFTSCTTKEYQVKLEVAPEDAGKLVGGGTYEAGEEVKLAAIPNTEYEFIGWSVDEEIISEEKVFRFKAQKDVDIKAEFDVFYDPKKIQVGLEEKGSIKLKSNTKNELDLEPKLEKDYEFIKFNENISYYREMEMVYRLIDFEGKEKSEYIMLNINDEGLVKVGPFYEKEEIIIKAEPVEGYKFSNWEIEQKIQEDEEIKIIVDKEDNEVKANYKFEENSEGQIDETNDDLEDPGKLIEEKKWKEFGEYLENLTESDIARLNSSDTKANLRYLSRNKYVEIFKNEELLTKDKLENLNWEEISLESPSLKILERDPEDIYLWFYEYESLMNNLRYLKIDILNEFNKEIVTLDAALFIEDIALQYKHDNFDIAYWKRNLGKGSIYVNNASGHIMRILDKELEVKDAIIDDWTITFKLEDRGIEKTIDIDYIKKDDGTFRVKDISDIERR